MDVAEEDERRRPERRRDLGPEVGEDVELGVERGAAPEIGRVAAPPAEGLPVGVLDASGVDAAPPEVVEDGGREVVPTTPTIRTGVRSDALIDEYVAAPPSTSLNVPEGISRSSNAIDPTMRQGLFCIAANLITDPAVRGANRGAPARRRR
jgi:hypothetical protein